jgi:hypothetical protein
LAKALSRYKAQRDVSYGFKGELDNERAAHAETRRELEHVDAVLARRPALADCKTRSEAIEKAIGVAAQCDAAGRELAEAVALLEQVRDGLDAEYHGGTFDINFRDAAAFLAKHGGKP